MLQFQNTKSTLLAALSFWRNGKHTCQCLGNKKSFSWQGLYPEIRSRTLFFPRISENLIYGSKHLHILDCVSRTRMHRRRKDYSGHDNYIQKDEKRLRRQFLVHSFHRLLLFYLVEGNERPTAWKFVMDEYNNERRKHILIFTCVFSENFLKLDYGTRERDKIDSNRICVLSETFLQ